MGDMADTDEGLSTPPRAGTYADLSRRMDRMENRHEDLVDDVRNLAAVVTRVEQNVNHGAELAKLRFDALEMAMKHGFEEAAAHRERIEAIFSGEVVTPQTKLMLEQYNKFVQDSLAERASLNARVNAIEDDHLKRDAARQGVYGVLSGTKGFLILIAAVLSPVVAIVSIVFSK